jgi:hypothetical protein
MEFNDYNALRDYTSEWMTESESKQLWLWLSKGMITSSKIIAITEDCKKDKKCLLKTVSTTAWKTFFDENNIK